MSDIGITFPIHLLSNSMICIMLGSIWEYILILRGQGCFFATESVSSTSRSWEGLSLSPPPLWSSCSYAPDDNGLMTFCSNKFSGSRCVIHFTTVRAGIDPSLSVASFSTSAGISVAVREKHSSPYLSGPTRLTSRQAVNIDMLQQKGGKVELLRANIFCSMIPQWNNIDYIRWWIAEKFCL